MNHTFTTFSPQIIIPITTPFNISFTLTPPPNFRPTPSVATRLLHVRTHEGKPKLTEIFELKVSGNGQLVCELSGYGNRQPEFRPPIKLDLPSDGKYVVRYSNGIVTVNNHAPVTTHIAATNGVTVELCFGFDKSSDELVAPLGWTLQTNLGDNVDNNPPPIINTPPPIVNTTPVVPNPPVSTAPPFNPIPPFNPNVPTPIPPQTIPPIIPPPPVNPNPHPEDQLKRELIQDLTMIATKYATARGIDPLIILAIQLLISRVK